MMAPSDSKVRRRMTLPRSMRLSGAKQFQAVRGARVGHVIDPLRIYALPNELPFSRLGLAVSGGAPSGKGSSAVTRNRIKRLLREAFRLQQHDLPQGYDFLIAARPHTPLSLGEYQQAIAKAVQALHTTWRKRSEH